MKAIYKFLKVPDALSPYVSAIATTNCDQTVTLSSPVKPTGSIFLGFKFRGELTGAINGVEAMPTGDSWLHIGGQLRDDDAVIRYSGGVGHLTVQLQALACWQLLGIPGIDSTGNQLASNQLPGWLQQLEAKLQGLAQQVGGQTGDEQSEIFFHEMTGALEQRIAHQRVVPRYVEDAELIIDRAYGACRVGEVADQVGVSVRQLNREFTRIVGLSPKVYCRVLQINRAFQAMLLDDSNYLSQVAAQASFADQAHFCRIFRQTLGDSPSGFLQSDEDMLFNFLARQEVKPPPN